MAQYFTDFSEYTTGAEPGDWSKWRTTFTLNITEPAGLISGKALELSVGSTGDNIFTWDAVPATADVEIVYRALGTTSSNRFVYSVLRPPNLAVDRSQYRLGGSSSNDVQISVLVPSFTELASTTISAISTDWIWVRAQVIGSALKVKQWKDVDPEPVAWTLETTDSTHTGAGLVGLWIQNITGNQLIDVVGVGTNGDTAPSEPVTATPTLTLPTATSITANSITPNVTVTF